MSDSLYLSNKSLYMLEEVSRAFGDRQTDRQTDVDRQTDRETDTDVKAAE